MCDHNETRVTEFNLLGFKGLYNYRTLLFIVLLLIYIAIVAGNLLIVFLVSTYDNLKIPMFFLLKNLAIADILLTTCVVPLMLDIVLKKEGKISVGGCIVQLYLFGIFGFVQCFIIAIMSYDRYVAISNPLDYNLIMSPNVCFLLVLGSWLLFVSLVSSEIFFISQFRFCGLNIIDHFFCDFGPVMKLSTSDTSIVMMEDFIISILILFFPFGFVLGTYIYIFNIILKIPSTNGKRKAFSTCSSHLTTVCAYYGTLITVYMSPTDDNASELNRYRALLYIVVTPLINPIIYSLRNHEIKQALQKMWKSIAEVKWR
ncbi:PREDICTED: olfactory receptor 11L1-like [Nanorana parkeri]|uniref:olfactory receptor 11L1-like n=1 Tax=Nanorana parkeri TaxID=125878 RepID=UPI000854F516|nr:PREDICTED: olfactory receptor 11L1-like [Nanorana parkeri]